MKTIVVLTCILLAIVPDTVGQVPAPVFNIRPANQKYLRYFMVQNSFDSATVGYTVGELAMRNGSTWKRIYWNPVYDDVVLIGSPGQGSDMLLATALRTGPFTYQGEDSIRFYRMAWVNGFSCDPNVGPQGGGHGSGSNPDGTWSEDDWWRTMPGAIKDNSIYVLEYVNATTGVTGTIDSISIGQNGTESLCPHGGTDSQALFHRRLLSGMQIGASYYIRIRPSRYGPTPIGMSARQIGSWISTSYLFGRSGESIFRINFGERQVLASIYADSALYYIDSVYQATGVVVPTFDMPLPQAIRDTVVHRYMDSVFSSGVWHLENKPLPNPKHHAPVPGTSRDPTTKGWVISMFPNPASSTFLVRVENVRQRHKARVVVLNEIGQQIAVLDRDFERGTNMLELPVSELPTGLYHVLLFDGNGVPVKSLPGVVIGR